LGYYVAHSAVTALYSAAGQACSQLKFTHSLKVPYNRRWYKANFFHQPTADRAGLEVVGNM
jgi:hypothetical protein